MKSHAERSTADIYNMLIGRRSSKQSSWFANEEACSCWYLNRFYRRRDQSGAVLGTCTPNWWSTSCKSQIFVVRFNKQWSLLSEDQLEVKLAFFEKMELIRCWFLRQDVFWHWGINGLICVMEEISPQRYIDQPPFIAGLPMRVLEQGSHCDSLLETWNKISF
jgi:hypothetical protein